MGIYEVEQELQLLDKPNEVRSLQNEKKLFLLKIVLLIEYIGKSTEKSSLKYEAWINRGKNRRETAERLGITNDGLRAIILYFNTRMENFIGKDTVKRIVKCESQQELDELKEWFWTHISTLYKGYFR
ncbi:hypothetical protein P8610_18090 [Fictibacillus sp. UD]|uniref:hypothetical protein n=1 Tax=Fictibacillus sp. UD TaxID=3038777 RepID=UPI0037455FFC